MTEGWYPLVQDYYIAGADPEDYPARQGDLFPAPQHSNIPGTEEWVACQVIHPSCEITAKRNPATLHVIGVRGLSSIHPNDQENVVAGRDSNGRVAYAHTFFLPPVGQLAEPMFSDFRAILQVPRADLAVENRVTALSHDARLYFIRRKLYWEQRWGLELSAVMKLEAERIGPDPYFIGPKPAWATANI